MTKSIIEKYDNVIDMFLRSARKYADHNFLYFNRGLADIVYTYEEELIRVKKVARYLINLGLHKGDKLILYIPTSSYWIDLFYACALLGVIVVPIDIDTPPEVIEKIIIETKPKYIFEDQSRTLKIHIDVPKDYVSSLDQNIFKLKSIKIRDYIKDIDPDDIMEIIYTSGTTGTPKGVQISHKNIVNNAYNVLLIFPIPQTASMLQILPLSHTYAQILTFGVNILGGSIIFIDKIDNKTIKNALNTHFINLLPVIPQVLIVIKDNIENKFKNFKLLFVLNLLQRIAAIIKIMKFRKLLFFFIHKQLGNNLEIIASGGAPLPPEVFKWWKNLGIDIYKGYGATETGPVITFEDKNSPDPYSIGKPIPNQMFKIDNSGELLAKGDHVTIGYFKNKKATKQAFTKDGWYKTGDIGYMKDGLVFLQGRINDMIVLANGRNIFPIDIEIKLNEYDEIKDSAVIGINFNRGMEVTAVISTDNTIDQVKRIIEKVNTQLTLNQTIKHILIWPAADFPRTHTHKIRKQIVRLSARKMLLEDNQKRTKVKEKITDSKDTNDLGKSIKHILSNILEKNTQEIKTTDILSSNLGLDSLGRADVLASISSIHKKDIDERDITTTTTVADLITLTKDAATYKKEERLQISTSTFNPIFTFLHEFVSIPLIKLISSSFLSTDEITGEFLASANPRIIIGNHRSYIDGFIFFSIIPKQIRRRTVILLAGDIWDQKKYFIWKRILEIFLPVYSIDRKYNANRALEVGAYFLNHGYNILLFPEGEIIDTKKGKKIKFKRGVSKLAYDFRPIITEIKISGLNKFMHNILKSYKYKHTINVQVKNKKITPEETQESIQRGLENDYINY